MRKTGVAVAVQEAFEPCHSACSLWAAYRLKWLGTFHRGKWAPVTPDVWGRFA